MVDCSHANSEKKFAKQEDVWRSVIQQRIEGTQSLIGLMVESHLHEGNQPIPENLKALRYGISHHRLVHRLGNHRADVALGPRNFVEGNASHSGSGVRTCFKIPIFAEAGVTKLKNFRKTQPLWRNHEPRCPGSCDFSDPLQADFRRLTATTKRRGSAAGSIA
jgi:hypothetical protein